MWETINFFLLFSELSVLFSYAKSIYKKKTINHTLAIFIVFIINFALHLVPYLYNITELGIINNRVFDVFECLSGAVRNFVGEVTTPLVVDYGKTFPIYSLIYSVGTLLAMGTAISTMLSIFNNNIINKIKVLRVLNSKTCNIIIGSNDFTCKFAQHNSNTIIMISPDSDNDVVKDLIENNYAILLKSFSEKFLTSKYLNKKTRYNIICACDYEEFLEYLDCFVSFKKQNNQNTNIYLYIEIEERKIELTTEELIAKSGYAEFISIFSKDDLIARKLVDDYSVAKNIPRDFLNFDTSLKNDVDIRVFMFGYGDLSKKVYKYFLLNNHFVTYSNDGYHPFPVKYHIYGNNINVNDWTINGMKETLNLLNREEYFPFPELSYETYCINHVPFSQAELFQLRNTITNKKTFNYIVIDLEDVYNSLEFAIQMRKLLNSSENYKIFVNSKSSFLKGYPDIVCYGDIDTILTEDIIVNESILHIAKSINENYNKVHQHEPSPCSHVVNHSIASELWRKLDYYSVQSNICAAMGLRVKLNLLGLDYIDNGKNNNVELITKRYPYKVGSSTFDCYSNQNLQNAMRAQEHSRWVTFHLLSKWIPMRKTEIVEIPGEHSVPAFKTKDKNGKKHVCITSQDGLAELSHYLSKKASEITERSIDAKEYEYFKNDDLLLINSPTVLSQQGFSIVETTEFLEQ